MDLMFGLSQQQSQQLSMNQQMRQALQILELGQDDLLEYVMAKAEENLFLEVRRTETGLSGLPPVRRGTSMTTRANDERRPEAVSPVSVMDDIQAQIRVMSLHPTLRKHALILVGDLDENGYLDEYSSSLGLTLGMSEDEYNQAVAVIQACDPLGIGARTLKECLLLQVEKVPDRFRGTVRGLIEHHLENLAKGQMTAISKDLNCSTDDLYEAIEALRRLNPKPGGRIHAEPVAPLRPDLYIQPVRDSDTGEGAYAVSLADEVTGILQIDTAYQGFQRGVLDADARKYLSHQWREAKWLKRCIVQRGMTLLRIGEALCSMQKDFLSEGWVRLHPMTLAHVAERLGIHESTVSRAIRNKYAATPQGIVELRVLFSASLKTATGEVSAEAMKHRIRQLIRGEKPEGPLTDADLASQFEREGIFISRRTIAKYRGAMGIPSAAARKHMA